MIWPGCNYLTPCSPATILQGSEMKNLPPTVRVLDLQRIEHPNILATADVEIGDAFVLRGVAIIQDPHTGVPRISPPQHSWTDENGRHYYTPCRFRKTFRKYLLTALLAHYNQGGAG